MNIVLKAILVVLGVLGFIVLIVWGYINYWFATKQLDRVIARGLNIGSDWVEIVPKPPLRIQKHVQYLILVMDGCPQRIIHAHRQIPIPDRTLIDPEVQVVDSDGNVRSLEPSSMIIDSSIAYKSDVRKDQVLTRVRIRCQTPFVCSRVIWECFRMK